MESKTKASGGAIAGTIETTNEKRQAILEAGRARLEELVAEEAQLALERQALLQLLTLYGVPELADLDRLAEDFTRHKAEHLETHLVRTLPPKRETEAGESETKPKITGRRKKDMKPVYCLLKDEGPHTVPAIVNHLADNHPTLLAGVKDVISTLTQRLARDGRFVRVGGVAWKVKE